jgi:hypothetical protein
MIGRALLSLVVLALAGFVALVLIGVWDRHSREAPDHNGTYELGYPSRPMNVVVPFPAGGPSDVVARVVAEHMGSILGQSMVIENVGGAGGTIGSARVAAAPPDGYTLLATGSAAATSLLRLVPPPTEMDFTTLMPQKCRQVLGVVLNCSESRSDARKVRCPPKQQASDGVRASDGEDGRSSPFAVANGGRGSQSRSAAHHPRAQQKRNESPVFRLTA